MSNIIIYQSDDGKTKLDVKLDNNTLWVTQEQMSTIFNRSKSTINEHILNIFEEKELEEQNVMRKFGNSDFSTKPTNYYNLDMVKISKQDKKEPR